MFTAQQLRCGAVEVAHCNDNVKVIMWYEGGVYHVEARETDTKEIIASRLFHTLKEAQCKFKRYVYLGNI